MMQWMGHIALTAGRSSVNKILFGYQKVRAAWGIQAQIYVKMDVKEMRYGGVEQTWLAKEWDQWQAVMNIVMNF